MSERVDVFSEREPPPQRLGLVIFLVSLGAMFVAVLIAYAYTRNAQPSWPDVGVPAGVWAATALLAVMTGTMHMAKRHGEQNRPKAMLRQLAFTLALAFGFVVTQTLNGLVVHSTQALSQTLYAATFYMLTGLHAIHVIGGMIPLGYVTYRAARGEYSSSRLEPLRLVTLYWDFLAVVWLVLLIALVLGS